MVNQPRLVVRSAIDNRREGRRHLQRRGRHALPERRVCRADAQAEALIGVRNQPFGLVALLNAGFLPQAIMVDLVIMPRGAGLLVDFPAAHGFEHKDRASVQRHL